MSLQASDFEHFVKRSKLIKDQSCVLLLDLKHDLVSLVSSLWLYQYSGTLLVDAGLMSWGSSELHFPINLSDPASLVSEGLTQSWHHLALLILPVSCDLFLVVILSLYRLYAFKTIYLSILHCSGTLLEHPLTCCSGQWPQSLVGSFPPTCWTLDIDISRSIRFLQSRDIS